MLHPAILFGGFFMIAAGVTGYTIFQVLQEQEFCQEDYPDMFRYSHDFDFHDMNEKQEVFTSDRYDLVQENTTLRNRKLPQETQQETAEQELKQLEESLTERKRRLLAEQAFLDREEEQLRQRQNELMQNEQQLNHVTDSQANTPSVAAIENPFFDNHDTSSSEDDDDDDVNDSHNTILVHETTVDTPNHDEVASTYSTSILDLSNHSLSDSIQSPRLIASSDSEESWDAMSAGELNELNSRRESTHWDE